AAVDSKTASKLAKLLRDQDKTGSWHSTAELLPRSYICFKSITAEASPERPHMISLFHTDILRCQHLLINPAPHSVTECDAERDSNRRAANIDQNVRKRGVASGKKALHDFAARPNYCANQKRTCDLLPDTSIRKHFPKQYSKYRKQIQMDTFVGQKMNGLVRRSVFM